MAGGTVSEIVVGAPAGDLVVSPAGDAPQLPLDAWRRIIGYHPYHFWQQADSSIVPVTSNCNDLVYEYSWMLSDQGGREDIRKSILAAEARLREHLDFSVGRRFVVETIQHPRPRVYGHEYHSHVSGEGRWLNYRLNEGHVRNLGVETLTAINANTPVSYTDEDGDGIKETFTVTFNTTVTDPDEIALYFVDNDRLDDEPLSERWRISPVKVTIADNGVATVKGRAWLLVKPIRYQALDRPTIDPTDPATNSDYVAALAVYRRHCDPTGTTTATAQAVLVWETQPYPLWSTLCTSSNPLNFTPHSTDPAAQAYALARTQVRDERLGEITVGRAIYDADSDQWFGADWGSCRQPDRVIVRYEAGARLASVESTLNQIGATGRWDEIVARFAAAELTRRICACDTANRELWRWQFDGARAQGAAQEQYRISDTDLANPFGTRFGAIYAWRAVQNLSLARAYLPG